MDLLLSISSTHIMHLKEYYNISYRKCILTFMSLLVKTSIWEKGIVKGNRVMYNLKLICK